MTRDEILDLVAPSKESTNKVTTVRAYTPGKTIEQSRISKLTTFPYISQWLASVGIRGADATGRDVVVASASVSTLEKAFGCSFYSYKHLSSGKVMTSHFGTLSFPDALSEIVDFVSGLTELWEPSHLKYHGRPLVESNSLKRNDVSAGYVIPAVLRNIYGIPSKIDSGEQLKSSVCVAEFQGTGSWNPDDLAFWNQQMSEKAFVNKTLGPFTPQYPSTEATLDVQYAFATSLNAESWVWIVQGWMYEFATALMNTPNPPLVVSMSWGWPEPRQCQFGSCTDSKHYVERVNTEFLKITGMGVTLLASSGDQGAPGDTNTDCNPWGVLSTIFPGASPYVTSVGATMLDTKAKPSPIVFKQPFCSTYPCAAITEEVACSYPAAIITSGGGFSNYVQRPSWQNEAVHAHLINPSAKLPPADYFSRGNRAFPDVSANGHAYIIAIGKQLIMVDGTSCASPVFAGVVALLNTHRAAQGKKPLGFINPMLYKAPANAFIDIVKGNNYATEACVNEYGYTTTVGWDPVTGLGTPNWSGLYNYVNNLH